MTKKRLAEIVEITEQTMKRNVDLLQDMFCQHCTCPVCRDLGTCEKCGNRTR